MQTNFGRGRRAVLAASLAAMLAAGAVGCSSGDSAEDDGGEVTLVLNTFGGGTAFGYDDVIPEFEAANPGIKVDYRIVSERFDDQFRPQLLQWLEAGSGAGDVVGIEEQGIGELMALSEYWTDLSQYGLDARKSDFPEWKWNLGVDGDGKLAALGTDVGGMAMCYRKDLFEAAGLPTDRAEVTALWPTWEDFTKVGESFKGKAGDAKFIDSPNTIYNVRMIQEAGAADGLTYFDQQGGYILDKTPAVKTAFDYVMELQGKGLLAGLRNWSDEWNAGMRSGGFATIGCPSWMLGVIQGNSGEENKGNWDVAGVPGGSGNWGGSWLGVPTQSAHPEEAAKLVEFLTGKQGQIGAFKKGGNFPSSVSGATDPEVKTAVNAYFSDAPTGQVFGDSVASFKPVYFGKYHSAVRAVVEEVILGIIEGTYSADEGWGEFVKQGKQVADEMGG